MKSGRRVSFVLSLLLLATGLPANADIPNSLAGPTDAALGFCSSMGDKGNAAHIWSVMSPQEAVSVSNVAIACKQINDMRTGIASYLQCIDSGKNLPECAATNVYLTGLCLYARRFSPSYGGYPGMPYAHMVPGRGPSSTISPLGSTLSSIAQWCDGRPPLKCCHRISQGIGCHSAFNEDGVWPLYGPINCEGNVHYGPVRTVGLCYGDPGCTCNHIPICYMGPDTILDQSPRANTDRQDSFFKALTDSFLKGLADGTTPGLDPDNIRLYTHRTDGYRITDDGQPFHSAGQLHFYSEVGIWQFGDLGFKGRHRRALPGDGSSRAVWNLSVVPGRSYRVEATWLPFHYAFGSDRASNATYRIYDGATLLGTAVVNQTPLPVGPYVDGALFQNLGTYTFNNGALRVELTNQANGVVVADAVRIIGPGLQNGDPSLTDDSYLNLVTFRGCRDWITAASLEDPFFTRDPHVPDRDEVARIRNLASRAAFRIMFGIPNVLDRLVYVKSRIFTAKQRADYLAQVPDPDAELLQWLSPLALRILQDADARDYQMLAIPVPGELPVSPGLYRDGCVTGNAAEVALKTVNDQGTVTLTMNVNDPDFDPTLPPEESGNPYAMDMVTIDWADGVIESGLVYLLRDVERNVFTHTYARDGIYPIRVSLTNGSGITTETTTTVSISGASGNADLPPSTSAVTIDGLSAWVIGYDQGPVSFALDVIDDSYSDNEVERFFINVPKEFNWTDTWYRGIPHVVSLGSLSFESRSRTRPLAFRLRPKYLGARGGGMFWFRELALDRYEHATQEIHREIIRPSSQMVQVYLGTSSDPVEAKANTLSGDIMIPAEAREVWIPNANPPELTLPAILDDHQTGYTEAMLGWDDRSGAGYRGTHRVSTPAPPVNTATWRFALPEAANVKVQITWHRYEFFCATNTPVRIYHDERLIATYSLNQTQPPVGETINGSVFQQLGTFNVGPGVLRVVLSNEANGQVVADAVRISVVP